MKKRIFSVFCGIATAVLISTNIFAMDITLNGNKIDFAQAPIIENGTTLVPMRAILEALGANVEWNSANQSVTAKIGIESVQLTIGSKAAYVGTTLTMLNTAPRLVNGTTMIPLRFLSESFGCTVAYNAQTKDISIINNSYKDTPSIPDLGKMFSAVSLVGSGNIVNSGNSSVVSYSYKGITDKQLEQYVNVLGQNGFERLDMDESDFYYAGSKGSSYIISIESGAKTIITISIFK